MNDNNTSKQYRLGVLALVVMAVLGAVVTPAMAAATPLDEYNTVSDWESAEQVGTLNDDGTVTTSYDDGDLEVNASLGTNTLGEVRLDLSNHTKGGYSVVTEINVYNASGGEVASRAINRTDISSEGVVIVDFSSESISGDGYSVGTSYLEGTASLTIDDLTVWNASQDATQYSPPADNSAPVADAGSSQTVSVGDSVSFDASGSTDADGDNLTYSWDLNGDGTEDATGVSPTHTFTEAGTYTAEVTVTDEHGATASAIVEVTVEADSTTTTTTTTDDTTTTTDDSTTSEPSGESEVTFEFNLTEYSSATDLEVRQNGSVVASQGLPSDASSVTENLSSGDYEVALVNDTGGDVVAENVTVEDSDLTVTVDGEEDSTAPVIGIGNGGGGSTAALAGGALVVLAIFGAAALARD